MSLVTQTITLSGDHHYGRRLPPQALGRVLSTTSTVVRQSISMALLGRSAPRGPRPRWLKAAADIRFIGHDGDDDSRLVFETPTLGEAARELYEQQEFPWSARPDPDDTGFDLLGEAARDIAAHNEDSDRFDMRLLGNLAGFRTVLDGHFREIRLDSRRGDSVAPAIINPELTLTAQQLRATTPLPQRVRVVGTLDMIKVSAQSFGLRLDDGTDVRGVLPSVVDVAHHIDRRVLVLGQAIYRASGRLLRIDADEIRAAEGEPSIWSRVPPPRRRKFDLAPYRKPQGPKSGMSAILGRWPGDETDEEIREALERLS